MLLTLVVREVQGLPESLMVNDGAMVWTPVRVGLKPCALSLSHPRLNNATPRDAHKHPGHMGAMASA